MVILALIGMMQDQILVDSMILHNSLLPTCAVPAAGEIMAEALRKNLRQRKPKN